MSTYKEIRGAHITTVTSDPPAPVNGQMWYNSTDRAVKGVKKYQLEWMTEEINEFYEIFIAI